jgi:hypothetical protein
MKICSNENLLANRSDLKRQVDKVGHQAKGMDAVLEPSDTFPGYRVNRMWFGMVAESPGGDCRAEGHDRWLREVDARIFLISPFFRPCPLWV